VSTDTIEQRLRTLYAFSVPTELDRRVDIAMTTVPIRRSGRLGRRRLAALAVAAIFAMPARVPRSSGSKAGTAPSIVTRISVIVREHRRHGRGSPRN
jgi:hypothetical protein